MQEAIRSAGISSKEIERGEIYFVRDELIVLPKSRIPNQPNRITHENRPVLILQTDADNQDVSFPIVLVSPVSHRVDLKDDKDYILKEGQGGLTRESLVQLSLVQPILKIELIGKSLGKLGLITMNDIDTILAANLGLIERPVQES